MTRYTIACEKCGNPRQLYYNCAVCGWPFYPTPKT